MALISISKAAKQGYASRPTLYRDIKSGKLSVQKKDAKGGTLIETSELVRVYGDLEKDDAKAESEVAALRQRLASVEAERDAAQSEAATLREAMKLIEHKDEKLDAERAARLADTQKRIDELQKRADEAEERARKAESRGIFGRLFGG